MATITPELETANASSPTDVMSALRAGLSMLGSLKLTVTLFAFSLVIVLVGTLAQDEMNMLDVKERYFLSWIAPLHIDDFFPQSFFPHDKPVGLVVPFPGGALIGLMLMLNLLAAKSTRFHVHAKGGRLLAGIACLIAGAAVAAFVIMAGHSSDGLQGTPPMEYTTLWAFVLTGIALLGIGLGTGAMRMPSSTIRNVGLFSSAIIAAFVLYSLATGFRIGDPGLRIVWQLSKGLGAGLILLVGCKLVFDRQGGNMLLHMGVALMMVGQFSFGDRQLEQRLNLVEGQSTNTFVNMDTVELAFMEIDGDQEHVIAIPGSRLRTAAADRSLISDPALPFDVRVAAYYENSGLARVGQAGADNLATAGIGLQGQAIEKPKAGGADSEVNVASAYAELLDKESGESQGTFLVSQHLSDVSAMTAQPKDKDSYDEVTAGEKTYKIGLKFQREVKPYWVQLSDVRQINYSGTSTPRDYSSFIRIVESDTGEERKERVWMNNPLRFRGETFYQSSYHRLPDGKEWTSIQVVRNSGWLIPYVACSITGIGLLAHFLGTLTRFLRRRERETRVERAEARINQSSSLPVYLTVAGFAALAIVALVPWSAVRNQMRPETRMTSYDWYTAGKIPVQFGGRIMPLDAYAQQTLKAISNRSSLEIDTVPAAIKQRVDGRKLSATQWLMEVAIDEPAMMYLPMIRVDAGEVRNELGIERRESKLYSLDEIRAQAEAADQIVREAKEKEPRNRTFKERKMLELSGRTMQYQFASESFRLPTLPDISEEAFQAAFPNEDPANRPLIAIRMLQRRMEMVRNADTPAIVAPSQSEAEDAITNPRWTPFAPAFVDHANEVVLAKTVDAEPPPGMQTFSDMIEAYGENDPESFNIAVDEHLAAVGGYPIPGYKPDRVALERWMQSNWPTGVAMFLYMSCLLMSLFYVIVNLPRLRASVWGILAVALAIHTLAIVCRIAITGRAPVINLYSAAVFIGWAAALFGLIIERLFRYGAGNLLAATAGVMSLMVAYGLNTGDTMPVLQAVLDTQFWLATHVVTVTLGYAATMAAGTVGIGYLVAGWFRADKKLLHNIYRFCYGATCFGILFSFIGTVLGGLWADDSWGRFWGWDPKENGALLIVIWNALMLHARWDGMVGPRGFASLSIGGNIVTAWSFFGTNELGIGLHSYGFTEGILMWLSIYVASQLVFVVIDGLLRLTGAKFGAAAG